MKERPILMSAPMVRAILDGTKTQTRRVVKWPAKVTRVDDVGRSVFTPPGMWSVRGTHASGEWGESFLRCPFGVVGDRLWVRETFALLWPDGEGPPENVHDHIVEYRADARHPARPGEWPDDAEDGPRWRPSIHMPRWASRITLEVTDVRVQRLQDISEDDARAEGVGSGPPIPSPAWWAGKHERDVWWTARDSFRLLWGSIYGADAWEANPWAWAVSFRRVTP